MKTTFSELLSDIISQSEISKNEMIRACDIDRSSFFKFLNGSRIPTMEQLNRICSKLQFTPMEEKKLRTEYARITNGERRVLSQDKIAKLLWKIEESEAFLRRTEECPQMPDIQFDEITATGKSSVSNLLISTILDAAKDAEGAAEVEAFLPPAADEMLGLVRSFIAGNQGKHIKFRHLIELPSRNHDSDRLIMDRVWFALICTLLNPDSYNVYYYYVGTPVAANAGVVYPYYVIAGHRVIMTNGRMDKAAVITDPDCCADFKNHFMSALNSARPLLRKISREELAAELTDPVIYRYGSRKVTSKLHNFNGTIYISPSGVRKTLDRIKLKESGEQAPLNRETVLRMLHELRDRLGTNVFFIDERYIPAARAWCMALPGREKLILYRTDNNYGFVITESELVQAFLSFMEELPNSGNLLRNDLALEIMDGIIASV